MRTNCFELIVGFSLLAFWRTFEVFCSRAGALSHHFCRILVRIQDTISAHKVAIKFCFILILFRSHFMSILSSLYARWIASTFSCCQKKNTVTSFVCISYSVLRRFIWISFWMKFRTARVPCVSYLIRCLCLAMHLRTYIFSFQFKSQQPNIMQRK